MALKGRGKRALQAAADHRTEFRHETLSARWETMHTISYGRLISPQRECLRGELSDGRKYFVIYSYSTPIAWHNGVTWYVPEWKYSVTTTNHQNVLRVAVAHPGFYASARW